MHGSTQISAVSVTLVDRGIGDYDCSAASGRNYLMKRGDITFARKVLSCQNGGGLGAGIYNIVVGVLWISRWCTYRDPVHWHI